MRIGLVVPGFSASAEDWCIPALRHLARHLALEDDVRVIAVRYPYHSARYTLDGAEVSAIGGATQRGAATLGVWRQALGVLRAEHGRRPFDLLHAFWATESGLLASLAGRILKIPTLISVAGGELVALPDIGYGDQRLAWERLKIATSFRLASAVSAGSHQLLHVLEHRAANKRALYLPLGIDVELFRPSHNSRKDSKLVHVGALTPVKDQHLLLRAFAGLRRRVPTATLEIVGDGDLRSELQQLSQDLNVADGVCFRGAVDHAYLPSVYAAADAFVLSSRHEAQGMVALEAAACGRPVVGTHVGIIPELAPAGAVSVPTRNEAALTDALEAVTANQQHGRALVEAEFALDRCVARFRAAYAALAAN